MGRQYMPQSFSSAACAAGDSPCASRTTLHCVVVKAIPPRDSGPIAVSEITSSAAALTPANHSKKACRNQGCMNRNGHCYAFTRSSREGSTRAGSLYNLSLRADRGGCFQFAKNQATAGRLQRTRDHDFHGLSNEGARV